MNGREQDRNDCVFFIRPKPSTPSNVFDAAAWREHWNARDTARDTWTPDVANATEPTAATSRALPHLYLGAAGEMVLFVPAWAVMRPTFDGDLDERAYDVHGLLHEATYPNGEGREQGLRRDLANRDRARALRAVSARLQREREE